MTSLLALLAACSGSAIDKPADSDLPDPADATLRISGTVTGDVIEGVEVHLDGEEVDTTLTDDNGEFFFEALELGNYIVTAGLDGFGFEPEEYTVTLDDANADTVDFVAYGLHQLSGAVDGDVLAGVVVALEGDATRETTTAADGGYVFDDLRDGDYSLTPSLGGFGFAPDSRTTIIDGEDVLAQDFTAFGLYSVAGAVEGDVLEGVTIALTGEAGDAVVTDSDGLYGFYALEAGTYTLAPALEGYSFSPASRELTLTADLEDQDFTAIATSSAFDFDDVPVGTVPSGWELVWNDAGQTVVATVDNDSTSNYLKIQSPDSPYYRFAVKNSAVSTEDVEVLFLTNGSSYFNFAIRGQGDSAAGHFAYIYNYGPTAQALVRETSSAYPYGGWTAIEKNVCVACVGADAWVRLRVEGSTVSARQWLDGSPEPADWDMQVVDAGVAGPGWFGPVTFTNYLTRVRRIAWATGGDTASF